MCHQQNRLTIVSREHNELCCAVKNSPFSSFLEQHYHNTGHKFTGKKTTNNLTKKVSYDLIRLLMNLINFQEKR